MGNTHWLTEYENDERREENAKAAAARWHKHVATKDREKEDPSSKPRKSTTESRGSKLEKSDPQQEARSAATERQLILF